MFRDLMLRVNLSNRAVPFVLLLATVLSFGLLIPWLGFFWDDWPVIFIIKTEGVRGLWGYYLYERPYLPWTYVVSAPILGTNPLGWHVFELLLRWLTSVSLWAVLRRLWPRQSSQVLWISLLFAVCPIFVQQPIAVTYVPHWICYLLYFVSIYFMLEAHEKVNRYYIFTMLALLSGILEMVTMEYFVGLELLRPVILWLYHRERDPHASNLIIFRRVVKSAWVYFVLLAMYTIWRLFILQIEGKDSHRLFLITQFLDDPLQTLIGFTQTVIRDFLYMMSSWFVALNPEDINLNRPFSIAVLGLVFAAGIVFWFLLKRYRSTEEDGNGEIVPGRLIVFGVLSILFGLLPVWLIGRQATLGALGSRFALTSIFGVSVIIAGVLEWLSSKTGAKLIVIAFMMGLAVHTNLYNTKSYQESWEKQRQFYWQLHWRAPYIQPETALISEGEIFPFVGIYSTSMGIALLYPPVDDSQNMPYWFFSYWEYLHKIPKELVEGTTLREHVRNYSFTSQSRDSIIVEFNPGLNRCLQTFTSPDLGIKEIPEFFEPILSITDLDRIKMTAPQADWIPPKEIFGAEPEHSWCYFFEKAELAGQYQDRDEVVRLMEEARQGGFAPQDVREYLPLLNAYVVSNRFEEAYDLTIRINRLSNNIGDSLCTAWLRHSETKPTPELDATFERVKEKLSCFD